MISLVFLVANKRRVSRPSLTAPVNVLSGIGFLVAPLDEAIASQSCILVDGICASVTNSTKRSSELEIFRKRKGFIQLNEIIIPRRTGRVSQPFPLAAVVSSERKMTSACGGDSRSLGTWSLEMSLGRTHVYKLVDHDRGTSEG